MIPINDIVFFGDRESGGVGDFVAHQDEDERAGAALLKPHVLDSGSAGDDVAGA
jgi:hypothetical protein